MAMTEHERKMFNEQINRAKSLEWERRIADKLHQRLLQKTWDERWILLRQIEEML